MRTLLWLCMLMLGLQFCVPAALHAAGLSGAVDELSLRSTDPEAPQDGSEVDEDLTLPGSPGAWSGVSPWVNAPSPRPRETDGRTGEELLPVAGFQPSAP